MVREGAALGEARQLAGGRMLPPAHPGMRVARVLLRFARRKPLGAVGLVIITLLILVAALAPLLAPYDPNALSMARLAEPLSENHLLGTDGFGRDVFSRLLYGARVSVTVGFAAVIVATGLALVLGVMPAYFAGWVDALCQRVIDAIMSFPTLILLLALVAVFGSGMLQLILILGFATSAGKARVFRSAVLAVKNNAYFEAARCIGASPARVIVRHVLPNIFAPMMITTTVSLGGIILAEAGLSFLGLGVPPPNSSWGNMLSVDGRRFMLTAPWLAIVPGLAITLVVFAFNMLGDALRDVLDPRLRGR